MSRSLIDGLPGDVRAELNQELIERNFTDYEGLAAFLAERGYEISKSSIHRYGSKMERRLQQVRMASEQAEAFVKALPDDDGAMPQASARMFHEAVFQFFVANEGGTMKDISAAGRALADVTRAGVTLQQQRQKALQEAADAVDAVARKQGLTPETASVIREAIEGAG